MKCIVVDDEPLARDGVSMLIRQTQDLEIAGSFSNTEDASAFLSANQVDLVFLDIQMPGCNGIDFAKTISPGTLVIFTTAFANYAVDSYEVDAIDYLLKPIKSDRFKKAVEKAISYHALLRADLNNIETIASDFVFVRADRKFLKVYFKDILYVEGLKDYVIIQARDQRVITAMNIKTIYERLPKTLFCRVNKSYIINLQHIDSCDNNTVFINTVEIPIGNGYRAHFFDEIVSKNLLRK